MPLWLACLIRECMGVACSWCGLQQAPEKSVGSKSEEGVLAVIYKRFWMQKVHSGKRLRLTQHPHLLVGKGTGPGRLPQGAQPGLRPHTLFDGHKDLFITGRHKCLILCQQYRHSSLQSHVCLIMFLHLQHGNELTSVCNELTPRQLTPQLPSHSPA